MWCWKCGNEVDDDSRFCPACGADQQEQTESKSFQKGGSPFPGTGIGGGEAFPRKPRKKKWIIGVACAAVLVTAALGFAFGSGVLDSDMGKLFRNVKYRIGLGSTEETGQEAESESGEEAETVAEQETVAAAETETESERETERMTEAKTETEAETEPGSTAQRQSEQETEQKMGKLTETEEEDRTRAAKNTGVTAMGGLGDILSGKQQETQGQQESSEPGQQIQQSPLQSQGQSSESGQQSPSQPSVSRQQPSVQIQEQPQQPPVQIQEQPQQPPVQIQEQPQADSGGKQAFSAAYTVIKCEDDQHYTYMRESTTLECETLLKLRKHNLVSVSEIRNVDGTDWGYAEYCGCSGWVRMKYLQQVAGDTGALNQAGTYFVSVDQMNLRETQSESAASLGKIGYGEALYVESLENGWGAVQYNGMRGYVYMPCLSRNLAGSYGVNTDADYGVHFRSTPDKDQDNLIGDIPNDTIVYISEFANGWGLVSYGGSQGWVRVKELYLV